MPTTVSFPRLAVIVTAIAGLLAWGQTANAHVTASPAQAPAEGYVKLDFSVGHGCEASPTTSISVQMPDQVVSATPQVVPGWEIETKEGELAKPVEAHGETITTGVREVTWRGGPLDPHHLEVFGLNVRFAGEAGDEVPFKVVQRCQNGEAAWIEVAKPGAEEPEFPAPVVTLTAAVDDPDHGTGDAAANGGDDADAEPESAGSAGAANSDAGADEDGDGPLPVIALIVSVIALLTAAVALAKRRTS